MILMHILFRGKSVSIANHRLIVMAIILLSIATGGWAQSATPTVGGPAQSDSFQPVADGPNPPDSVAVALPDDPGISASPSGTICGTVTDGNGDIIPEATVMLEDKGPAHQRTAIANDNGFFQFANIAPGDSYRVIIHSDGFVDWSSDALRLQSGQVLILNEIALVLKGGSVSVRVTASTPEELAVEQVRIAEQQRILGLIPNFFVVYDRNPVPLTSKLKFRLSLRVAVDPVTFFGVATMAAIDQAANTPNYVEGAKGYGQRFGAIYADAFTDTMLAGTILPSLLHQDPRYYYQGTGTTRSRLRHALLSPFICRGDNGNWQPNYSSIGGNLGTTAMSELWYPKSNRGYGLVFGNFLIGEGERMVSGIAQEFLIRRLTPGAAKNQ
jgi:Carboxypeptidase regulatory-like domain